MSTDAKYSDIKSSSASPTSRYRQRPAPTSDINELHARLRADPRFNPPPPSPWKRAALILFVVFLLWFAYTLRKPLMAPFEPKVVHARRYSQDYQFRPAASPIITETLRDGRVRVRGAMPTLR